jgi:uncharacterized protein VirK/YbjX
MFKPTPTSEEIEALRTFLESTRYNKDIILEASNELYFKELKRLFPEEIADIEKEVKNSKTKTIYFIHSPEINKKLKRGPQKIIYRKGQIDLFTSS